MWTERNFWLIFHLLPMLLVGIWFWYYGRKRQSKSIDGVEIENVDEEIRKYENIIRDGIEPRIVLRQKLSMFLAKRMFLYSE